MKELKMRVEYWLRYLWDTRPKTMVIEVTNKCNYSCPMCWMGKSKRKKGFMRWETFVRSIDYAKKFGIKTISLSYGGETLLHPHIFKMIRLVKHHGFECYLVTNGFLLNKWNREMLIKSGLDKVEISFHADDSKQYKKIFGKDNYDIVLNNLKQLSRSASPSLTISLNYYLCTENQKTYGHNEKMLSGYYTGISKAPMVNLITSKRDLSVITSVERKVPCLLLLKTINVLWDGTVCLGCCFDANGYFRIGNIMEDSLDKLWNKSRGLRRKHLFGGYRKIPLCKNCPDEIQIRRVMAEWRKKTKLKK